MPAFPAERSSRRAWRLWVVAPWRLAMTLREITSLVRSALNAFEADDAPLLSGAIAFYTLLSMAPLALVAVWLAGLFFGEAETMAWLASSLGEAWGEEAAAVAVNMIERIRVGTSNPLGLVIGAGVLLYGASKVFVSLQAALNTIWNVREKPRTTLKGRVKGLVRKRLLSFVMIITVGGTLVSAMLLRAGLVTLHRLADDLFPFATEAWRVFDLTIGLVLVTLLFTMIFRVLPDAKMSWKTTLVGAAITATMFNLGSYLISFYFAYAGTATLQGAAGSVIAILLWVYFSAHVFFLGAELTGQMAETYGGGIEPDPHAERFERVTT
jgi:membrane protein